MLTIYINAPYQLYTDSKPNYTIFTPSDIDELDFNMFWIFCTVRNSNSHSLIANWAGLSFV